MVAATCKYLGAADAAGLETLHLLGGSLPDTLRSQHPSIELDDSEARRSPRRRQRRWQLQLALRATHHERFRSARLDLGGDGRYSAVGPCSEGREPVRKFC